MSPVVVYDREERSKKRQDPLVHVDSGIELFVLCLLCLHNVWHFEHCLCVLCVLSKHKVDLCVI